MTTPAARTPIQNARERAGLTRRRLATAIGPHISIGAVRNWERGSSWPDPDSAIALLQVLPGLTLEAIYESQPVVTASNDPARAEAAMADVTPKTMPPTATEPAQAEGWLRRVVRRLVRA